MFLDYANPLEITRRHLPHWRQPNVMYFVTFRLGDSIPAPKLAQWRYERQCWLESRSFPLADHELAEFHRLFSERMQGWLDAGYGGCVLQRKAAADEIRKSMHFFDGQRYALDEYVVMPNHVHVILAPKPGFELSDILRSWKSFSATQINRLLGRKGQLWQHESYDHIVRSEKQLHCLRQYIRDNPRK